MPLAVEPRPPQLAPATASATRPTIERATCIGTREYRGWGPYPMPQPRRGRGIQNPRVISASRRVPPGPTVTAHARQVSSPSGPTGRQAGSARGPRARTPSVRRPAEPAAAQRPEAGAGTCSRRSQTRSGPWQTRGTPLVQLCAGASRFAASVEERGARGASASRGMGGVVVPSWRPRAAEGGRAGEGVVEPEVRPSTTSAAVTSTPATVAPVHSHRAPLLAEEPGRAATVACSPAEAAPLPASLLLDAARASELSGAAVVAPSSVRSAADTAPASPGSVCSPTEAGEPASVAARGSSTAAPGAPVASPGGSDWRGAENAGTRTSVCGARTATTSFRSRGRSLRWRASMRVQRDVTSRGSAGSNLVEGTDGARDDVLEDLAEVVRLGGEDAGEAAVEDEAEGPDVGARVDVLLAERLLRRHVMRRAQQRAGRGERAGRGRVSLGRGELGDAEIEHLDARTLARARAREEDVGGLEVAVDDAEGVGGADRADHGQEDGGELGERELHVGVDARGERFADQELHHHHRRAVLELDAVVDLAHVGVPRGARGPRLAHQAAP